MASIKAGIIGYGLSGQVFHAPFISRIEGFELKTIVTSSNAARAKRDYPGTQIVDRPDELINDPEIDLVVVGTPNTAHYLLAKAALLSGKHVVVEKPFVNTIEEGEELIRLAEENDCLLSVYQNRRWDGDFMTIRKLIANGALGDIYTYESHFDRFRLEPAPRWREQELPGSGMLFDLGAHLIDQALVLFGWPQTIWADAFAQRPGSPVVDYFHLVLGYGSLRVILHSGMVNRKPGPRFQVHGSKGSYIKYGLDPQEDALKAGMRPGDPAWGREKENQYGELTTLAGDMTITGKIETLPGSYEAYYQGILAAITSGAPLPVTAEAGLNVIKIVELALKSSRDKKVLELA